MPNAWFGSASGVDEVEEFVLDVADVVEDDVCDDVCSADEAVGEPEEEVASDCDVPSCRFKSTEDVLATTPDAEELKLVEMEVVGTGTVDEPPPALFGGGISTGHRLHSPRNASQ